MSSVEGEERFAALAGQFADCPGVEGPDESRAAGGLVVKLPRERVDALIATGRGRPFGAGKGRPMKEWVTVTTDAEETWASLAREALQFVGSKSRGR